MLSEGGNSTRGEREVPRFTIRFVWGCDGLASRVSWIAAIAAETKSWQCVLDHDGLDPAASGVWILCGLAVSESCGTGLLRFVDDLGVSPRHSKMPILNRACGERVDWRE